MKNAPSKAVALSRRNYLELRWVDDDLQPIGDWHTAVTWPVGTQNLWKLVVDQLGRALVISFVFPPTLGSPPDPSMWDFSARWMGRDGPISEPFMPVIPTYTSPDGRVFFADWDIIRPLREGGFAMYHPPLQGPGTLSHSGWYASYPSALAEVAQPPSWLAMYDGSLQLVAGGAAYAAIRTRRADLRANGFPHLAIWRRLPSTPVEGSISAERETCSRPTER